LLEVALARRPESVAIALARGILGGTGAEFAQEERALTSLLLLACRGVNSPTLTELARALCFPAILATSMKGHARVAGVHGACALACLEGRAPGVLSCVRSALAPFNEPRLARLVSGSDFTLGRLDAPGAKVRVDVRVPLGRARAGGVLVSVLLNLLTQRASGSPRRALRVVLDDALMYGHGVPDVLARLHELDLGAQRWCVVLRGLDELEAVGVDASNLWDVAHVRLVARQERDASARALRACVDVAVRAPTSLELRSLAVRELYVF
jgi:hypothetical protein